MIIKLNLYSNCIDIGCHKGEILDLFIKNAPEGHHFGFEPIPDLINALKIKYAHSSTEIHDIALSNSIGMSRFNYVISNPAYSGIQKRKYDNPNEQDIEIKVATNLLDNIIPANLKIDLIKIDVEGGELLVLEGAIETLKRNKPIIIFEHGLGAADAYNATPEKIYNLFLHCNMKVNTMSRWLKNAASYSLTEFAYMVNNKGEYYFIAY
jgi:FkbM family methyltransferase